MNTLTPYNESFIRNMSYAEQLRVGLIDHPEAEMLVYDAEVGCDAQYALDCHQLETPANEDDFESLIDDLKAECVTACEALESMTQNLEALVDAKGAVKKADLKTLLTEIRQEYKSLLADD